MQCNMGPFIAYSRYVSSVDDAVNILWEAKIKMIVTG
jgi:hypothetical protein